METKSIFKSKTFWVNAIVFALAIADLVTDGLLTAFGVPKEVQPRVMIILAFIVAILNIWLRMNTNQPVSIQKQEDLSLKSND